MRISSLGHMINPITNRRAFNSFRHNFTHKYLGSILQRWSSSMSIPNNGNFLQILMEMMLTNLLAHASIFLKLKETKTQ